jgi:hypothetical protein
MTDDEDMLSDTDTLIYCDEDIDPLG